MAKYEDGSYGSAAGIALIAKVLAGRCAMKYTRVAVGKGNIPDDKTPKTMTEPADYVMDAVIAGITNPVDGECQVTVQINSANVDKGFYCTAVVLYAEDPDEGEVPYTYLVLENEPEWIRPASSIVGKLATIDLIAVVGGVDTVTAAIDPEAIATVAAVNDLLQRHNEDPEAHAGIIMDAVGSAMKKLEEEAFLSKNKEGIKICVNGCNTQDHVGHVLAAGGDRDMILGCHNYYPHRYTGVSLEHFEKGSAPMVKHNLRLQSFVTSQNPEAFGPWPVTEGLPTLEMHRDWPIEIQVGHYVMMGYVNDIIIANAYATDAELKAMAAANSTKIMFHMTPAEGLSESMKKRLRMNLSVRGDSGEWIIRTLESRMLREATEPFNTVDIQPGDVLIDNNLYGQYAGEVQIARKPMKNYGKTNVVGHIDPREVELLPYMKGSTPFGFNF